MLKKMVKKLDKEMKHMNKILRKNIKKRYADNSDKYKREYEKTKVILTKSIMLNREQLKFSEELMTFGWIKFAVGLLFGVTITLAVVFL